MDKDEVDAKANRLIYVKKSIAEFEEEEIEIKDELEPYVKLVRRAHHERKKWINSIEVEQSVTRLPP